MTPEMQPIFDRVEAILRTHTKVDTVITPDVQMGADLSLDSVDMFDLVMEIEEAYDISFPIEEASSISTVGALVEAIGRRTNA